MKIVLLILLSACTIIKADFPPRYKIRGPLPQYHFRVPPNKQFAKKWNQPSRGGPTQQPIRSRPLQTIPVHMPMMHKVPIGLSSSPPRTVSPPVRTFWKNTQNNVKFPAIEKLHQIPQVVKKQPFISAPSLPVPEYEYHIQTNTIPNGPVNTIKQIGEKGPIHTIPAPNLSLKDKPIVVSEVRQEPNYPQTTAFLQFEQNHHYHVTEHPESEQAKLFRGQQEKLQQLQQQQFQQHQLQQQQMKQQQQQLQQQKLQKQFQEQNFLQQKLQHYQQQLIQQQFKQQQPVDHFQTQQSQTLSEVQIQPQQIYLAEETSEIRPNVGKHGQQGQVQGEVILNNQLSPKELYQLLGTYPQNIVPSGSVQSVKIQPSFPNENFYQQNQEFDLNTESTKSQLGNIHFKPEFQSFNYDEQAHQASQKDLNKKELSSLVTATYTLSPSNVFTRRGQVEPAEAPHKAFESRSDLEVNGVSEEKSIDNSDRVQDKEDNTKVLETSYYSSLPSKEAADRLADLQAAGKINHNLMELSNSKDDMAIFISDGSEIDEEQKTDNEEARESAKGHVIDYEEYEQDENNNEEVVEQNSKEFGSRIAPKKKN